MAGDLANRLEALVADLSSRLDVVVGGPARRRVVVIFAGVLALDSADGATVGAIADELERALRISNTELGLLVSLPSLIGALATIPVGMLADRTRRVALLAASILVWGMAMIASGVATSFSMLLLTRLALGAVTATAGPTLASLTGDLFPAHDRGRIYGFMLTGELIGAGFGFMISGLVASALSWRAAFFVLALPSVALAVALWRSVPEPARGGQSRLEPGAQAIVGADEVRERAGHPAAEAASADAHTLAADAVESRHIRPHEDLVLHEDPARMPLAAAVRYVLSVRTNVVLIVASALGYFYFAGVRTFGVDFFQGWYGLSHAEATLLLVALGAGALVGVLVSGRTADWLIRHGRLNGRIVVAAIAYLVAVAAFLPALLMPSLGIAILLYLVAAAALAAPNPPLDAARLDIMHSRLWGRAESVRTVLRLVAVAIAPVLFGLIADLFSPSRHATSGQHGFGATASAPGLHGAFLILLIMLAAGGLVMFRAMRTYPRDVATATASERETAATAAQGSGQPSPS